LNSQFRGKQKSTDVLSFEAKIPVKGKADNILGDVVINISKAQAQAMSSGIGFYDELYRLLVHGVLHLLGYDHEKSKYGARIMRKKEKEILNALKKIS
jgi:probable rRNA maturation factor